MVMMRAQMLFVVGVVATASVGTHAASWFANNNYKGTEQCYGGVVQFSSITVWNLPEQSRIPPTCHGIQNSSSCSETSAIGFTATCPMGAALPPSNTNVEYAIEVRYQGTTDCTLGPTLQDQINVNFMVFTPNEVFPNCSSYLAIQDQVPSTYVEGTCYPGNNLSKKWMCATISAGLNSLHAEVGAIPNEYGYTTPSSPSSPGGGTPQGPGTHFCQNLLASNPQLTNQCQQLHNDINASNWAAACTSPCFDESHLVRSALNGNCFPYVNDSTVKWEYDSMVGFSCVKDTSGQYCMDLVESFVPPKASGTGASPMCDVLDALFHHLGCCAGTMIETAHLLAAAGASFGNRTLRWNEIQLALSTCNPVIVPPCADTPSSTTILGSGGQNSSDGISGGTVAGIIIGILLLVALVIAGAYFFMQQNSAKSEHHEMLYAGHAESME